MERFDLGDAPQALDMPRHRLADELSKRGLKPSGFPIDDARRLQTFLDKEWEATKSERLQEAREAYLRKRKLEAVMAARAHEELQLREEAEAVAKDATAAFYLRLIASNATPPSLSFRALTPPAQRACVKALGANTSLRELDLSGCRLDDDAIARALARLLAANAHLLRLDLDANALTAGGAAALAEGLRANATLAALSLEGNALCTVGGEIGRGGGAGAGAGAGEEEGAPPPPPRGAPDYAGFQALAAAAAAHPALRSLSVYDCGLGREGGAALARALAGADARAGGSGLLALQISPTDGCSEGDVRACMEHVRRNCAAVAAEERARLDSEALAVRAGEAASAAAAAAAAAAAVAEWGAREAEKREAARREADGARLKEEILARARRATEYKAYLEAKAHAEAEKALKAAKKK